MKNEEVANAMISIRYRCRETKRRKTVKKRTENNIKTNYLDSTTCKSNIISKLTQVL